jgi:tetratricopeptide (TPR) repeat protein
MFALIAGLLLLAGAVAAGIYWAQARKPDGRAEQPLSAGGKVLDDIARYRENSGQLPPAEAVRQWFGLFDRAAAVAEDFHRGDFDAFDMVVSAPVSERSMFAALPPPSAWREFRKEAESRTHTTGSTDALLAIRYLAELLNGDRPAAHATLDRLAERGRASEVRHARALLARVYGDATEQLVAFGAELDRPAEDFEELAVPDLAAITDSAQAEKLLLRAVQSPRTLRLETSEPTRQLMRRVALANVSRMKRPQWALAHGIDAARLYEAMSRRFADDSAVEESLSTWHRRLATQYYFLAMVMQGRQRDAERALTELSRSDEGIRIPREAVEALQRAHLNEQLFRFLDGLLQRQPGIPAWELYIEQAAFTGHGQEALQRIETALAREDLAPAQRIQLQSWRLAALLAADRIEQAEVAARELFAQPAQNAAPVETMVAGAVKAMLAGRLLQRPGLSEPAVEFARGLVSTGRGGESATPARVALYQHLRASGRAGEALALASAHLARTPASFSEAVMRRLGSSEQDQASLAEMASIYLAEQKYQAVLDLLQNSPHWGASDIVQLVKVKDSLGVPMSIIAARALSGRGDTGAALRVARASVAALPGEDAGYELVAKLDPNAIEAFDALFALDEFEERPLIWKASLQFAGGADQEAEATIRRAIAIDPSDGEEGPNDRMRAYAVLSQILARQGDAADSRLYANAVEAIRLSEQGDRFHSAGLYQRAFATYREALEKFSDAYCIQSRLAVQLNKQGRRQEALVHYRRAYELMPASFGRVESHCFGCESVFEGPDAQTLAERTFNDIIRRTPDKPQAYYLLAYLREHQGRHAEAVQPQRSGVARSALSQCLEEARWRRAPHLPRVR